MLKQRVITAVVALVVLLLALFVLPKPFTQLLIAALMLVAVWEWAGLSSLHGLVPRMSYLLLVAAIGAALWYSRDFHLAGKSMFEWTIYVALLWWTLALVWIFFYPTAIPKAFGWLAGALVTVPAFLALERLYLDGAVMLLLLLTVVWAADIGAYFSGRHFGRVKLAPQVSPGKSWEGVFGGMAAVGLLAIAASRLLQANLAVLLPLCLAVAAISIVGDLTVSVFKRNAGVKDSGTLFPGHGGVLDRIDSVTAAAPLFVLGSVWAGLRG